MYLLYNKLGNQSTTILKILVQNIGAAGGFEPPSLAWTASAFLSATGRIDQSK
jgi:hypothetical protein